MSDLAIIEDDAVIGASADGISNAIASLARGESDVDIFTTYDAADAETGLRVWASITESEPVKQNLNTPLVVTGVIIQRVELTNEQTGELTSQPRITFVTADKSYHVTSPVVLRDVRTLFGLLGKPSEASPVTVKFIMGGTGTRQFVTMKPAKVK